MTQSPGSIERYDSLSRLLHLLIALGITAEQLTSLAMITPKPGRIPNEWYAAHQSIGIILLGVLVAYWLRTVSKTIKGGEPLMLFPWVSVARLSDLGRDICATIGELVRFKLVDDGTPRPLASAIQGLGLLLGLFLALTGTALALTIVPDVALSPAMHAVKETHELAGNVMWVYLVLHPAMAILHQLAGHETLGRMFGRGR